jgi:hypothetical protein
MITSADLADREQTERVNRTMRAWSTALRELSRNARQRSEGQRLRNATARQRAGAVSAASSAMRHEIGLSPFDLTAEGPDRVPSVSSVSVAELADILVTYHAMEHMEAHLSLAVEMEVAEIPTEGTTMTGAAAMDLLQSVLRRRTC